MNLFEKKIIEVRFHEVDTLDVVWHGHYVKYMEVGREAFGVKYEIGYREMREHGILIPVVKLACDYKKPLRYGDLARIEVRYIYCKAAKIIFEYKIFNDTTNEFVASGQTEQVFVEVDTGDLILTYPEYFINWLAERNVITK